MKTPLTLFVSILSFTVFLSGLLFLSGCDTLSPDGKTSQWYQSYSGIQTNWPVNPTGGFVSYQDGMTIYHGFPPMPYKIIGRFNRPNIALNRVVLSAKYHHADVIFLLEESYLATDTDPGIMFFNSRFAVSTPSTTRTTRRIASTAYLATTNLSAIIQDSPPAVIKPIHHK